MLVKMPNGVDRDYTPAEYEKLRGQVDRGHLPPVPKAWAFGEEEWEKATREAFNITGGIFWPKPDVSRTCHLRPDHKWGFPQGEVRPTYLSPGQSYVPVTHEDCHCRDTRLVHLRMASVWPRLSGCRRLSLGTPLSGVVQAVVVGTEQAVLPHIAYLYMRSWRDDWRVVSIPDLREAARPRSFEMEGGYTESDVGEDEGGEEQISSVMPSLWSLATNPDVLIILVPTAPLLSKRGAKEALGEAIAARSGRVRQPTYILCGNAAAATAVNNIYSLPTLEIT